MIVVLGAGESGVGAAILAKIKGFPVFVSDNKSIIPKYKDLLLKYEISFEENGHSIDKVQHAQIIIKSPGIPPTLPLIKEAHNRGVQIISEIEWAFRFISNGKVIAITGSNGKTTTSTLIYQILKEGGKDVALCGNIGNSFALQVCIEPKQWYVVEVSSFQLEDIISFRPYIAVITNIYENHLNRYQNSMDLYALAKMNLLKNMTEKDHLVYCLDSPILLDTLKNLPIKAQMYGYSMQKSEKSVAYINNLKIHILMAKRSKRQEPLDLNNTKLTAIHNRQNAMAGSITGRIVDIRNKAIQDSLKNFENIEHRIEYVDTINGISFINDSKATNVNSAWYAIDSQNAPVIWIAGGQDKGNDYGPLVNTVKEKVKALVLIGTDVSTLKNVFSSIVPTFEVKSMQEAVEKALEIGSENYVVLLSPTCASFDMFENYEDRGNKFKDAVKNVAQLHQKAEQITNSNQ